MSNATETSPKAGSKVLTADELKFNVKRGNKSGEAGHLVTMNGKTFRVTAKVARQVEQKKKIVD